MDGVRGLNHEAKLLKWKLKQANKTMGRQGETIYDLRCEIAYLRQTLKQVRDDRDVAWSKYYDATAPTNGQWLGMVGDQDALDNLVDKLAVPPSSIEGLA